jgi:hypothetical protein
MWKITKEDREDRSVRELIDEQRKKESVEVWRRGFCISEASSALYGENPKPEELIRMAEAIYQYVYGNSPGEESK